MEKETKHYERTKHNMPEQLINLITKYSAISEKNSVEMYESIKTDPEMIAIELKDWKNVVMNIALANFKQSIKDYFSACKHLGVKNSDYEKVEALARMFTRVLIDQAKNILDIQIEITEFTFSIKKHRNE